MGIKNPFQTDHMGNSTSPDALVDKLIGTAYTVVKLVHDNLQYIKHLSLNMGHVVAIETHIADIQKVADNINYVIGIGENLPGLIAINASLSELNEVYQNLPIIVDVHGELLNIARVGSNIEDVKTVAADITAVRIVAENIAVITEAYDGALTAASKAAASAAEAKTSASGAATSASDAKRDADRAKLLVDAFAIDTEQAFNDLEAARVAAVKAVNDNKVSALSEMSTKRTEHVTAINTAGNTQTAAVNSAGSTATSAITTAQDGAIVDIRTRRDAAVKTVNDTGTAATKAVTDQQGVSVKAVTDAQKSATTDIETKRLAAVKSVGDTEAGVLTKVKAEGDTQTSRVNRAGDTATTAIAELKLASEASITELMEEGAGYVAASKTNADDAEDSADRAEAAVINMAGGTTGQFLVKDSNENYAYRWADLPGGGDMTAAVYDPNGYKLDVYNMDNMKDGLQFFRLSLAEKAKLEAFSYNSLTDVPTTFTPKTHTHTIAQVNGLDDRLNTLVAGPNVSVTGSVAVFDGTTGKLIAGSAYTIAGLLDRTNHTGNIDMTVVSGLETALAGKTSPADVRSITGGSMTGRANPKMADGTNLNVYWTEDTPFPYPASPPYIMGATTKGEIYATLAANLGISTAIQTALDLKAGLELATAAIKGLMSPAQFTKLNGVQAGAQVNPDMALYQTVAQRGVANGYASLDGAGKIPVGQLPDSILGAMIFQGFWNAATNTPAIPAASAANKGHYRIVQVTGNTVIDGTGEWVEGDWIVSNGVTWGKIANGDAVTSVAGLTGNIEVVPLQTALGLKSAAYQESSAFSPASLVGTVSTLNEVVTDQGGRLVTAEAAIVDHNQRLNAGAASITLLGTDITALGGRLGSVETASAANTAARHTHANIDILNATTASFTTAWVTTINGKVAIDGGSGLGFFTAKLKPSVATGAVLKPTKTISNYQSYGNVAPFELQAPDSEPEGAYTLQLFIWAGAGSGAMTATGFNAPPKGSFNPAATNILTIRVIDTNKYLTIEEMV